MDDENKKKSQQAEEVHREMYHRSRDILRVYNPLSTDFKFKYDSVWYKVPAGSTKDFERYLARKFFHDISAHMIGLIIQERGNRALEERRSKGLADLIDKYEENRAIWDKMPRMDNKQLLEEIGDQVILGLVEEFGAETEPDNDTARRDSPDPTDVQIVERFSQKSLARKGSEPQVKPIKKALKKDLAKEVTEEGEENVSNEGQGQE